MALQPRKTSTPTLAHQIGAAIRERRIALGLSQEELGFASSTHRTYIGAIERGQKAITLAKLNALAHALKCRPSQILANIGL